MVFMFSLPFLAVSSEELGVHDLTCHYQLWSFTSPCHRSRSRAEPVFEGMGAQRKCLPEDVAETYNTSAALLVNGHVPSPPSESHHRLWSIRRPFFRSTLQGVTRIWKQLACDVTIHLLSLGPRLPHLWNGDNNTTYVTKALMITWVHLWKALNTVPTGR